MANRRMFEPLAINRGLVMVCGNGTGAGAADLTGVVGKGISAITQQATGTYRIELEDSYPLLLSCSFNVLHATADFEVNASVINLTATIPFVEVRTQTGGAETDLTSSEILFVNLVFRNTSVP